MADVVCLEWLRMFDAEELQILISGADTEIDVEDLRAHTEIVGGMQTAFFIQKIAVMIHRQFSHSL